MRKTGWPLLQLLVLTAALGGCSDKVEPQVPDAPAPSRPPNAAPPMRIGLVFDVGGLGDKSFNDSANRGLERAQAELGVVATTFEPREPADRESGLLRFARERYSLIVGVGFLFTDDMLNLSLEYPDLKFACVDMTEKTDSDGNPVELPPNLVGLKFREEEGAFLVGALAGLCTKTSKVGFVGGMNVPLIHKFEAGYYAGVRRVCPECEVLTGYAGEKPEAFKDAAKGKSLALGMYSQGADIIFHAAGQTGRGVFEAAIKEDKLAIGVDSDQAAEAPGHVLTSMVKGVDTAVFETVRAVFDGKFKSGMRVLGLAEGGVGFVLDDANRDLIPAEVLGRVNQLREQIIAGEIKIPVKR